MTTEGLRLWTVPWDLLSAAAGTIVLGLLWLGPLASLSHTAFSAHMLLHLGLMLVAAPLLAMPVSRRLPSPRGLGDALAWYLLAGAFEMLVVLAWHIPLLHDAAGHNALLFAAEQLSFLAAGVALWACIFSARRSAAAIAAALVAALTFSHMSMFGLMLALVPTLIYDPNLCQGWFGIYRLNDQHLGGALMAAGGLMYLLAAVVLFMRAVKAAMEPAASH